MDSEPADTTVKPEPVQPVQPPPEEKVEFAEALKQMREKLQDEQKLKIEQAVAELDKVKEQMEFEFQEKRTKD